MLLGVLNCCFSLDSFTICAVIRTVLITLVVFFLIESARAESFERDFLRLRIDSAKLLRIVEGLRLAQRPNEKINNLSRFEKSFAISAIGMPIGSFIEITEVKNYLAPLINRQKGLFLSALFHLRGEEPKQIAISYFHLPTSAIYARVALANPRLNLSYIYEFSLDAGGVKVRRVPSYALAAASCADKGSEPKQAPVADNSFYSALYRYRGGSIELITDTDDYYVDYFGRRSAANRQILSTINAADTFFHRELNIRLSVISQFNSSSYPDISKAQGLLCSFSGKDFPPADTVLLFSGKHLRDSPSLVGLAWEGGVCVRRRSLAECRSYVFVNRALIRGGTGGVFDHIILAHELGHSLGAVHDLESGRYFMGRTLDVSRLPETFSPQSRRRFYRILHGGLISSRGRLPHSWRCLESSTSAQPSDIVQPEWDYDLGRHRVCTNVPPVRLMSPREFYPDFIKWQILR